MYTEGFAKRIDIAVDKIGGVGKASTIIGVSNPTIGRWKEGSSDPKLSNILAFARAAGVSLDWLVFGDEKDSQAPQTGAKADDEYVYIPAYDIAVSAGHGMFSDGALKPHKHLAFRRDWVSQRGLIPKCLAVLFNDGDSMEPTIPDKSAMVINREQDKALDGQVYVIRIDDRLYVKRVQWIPTGGIRLISDNKNYDSFDITKADMQASDIEVCGQVIHVSHDIA